MEWWISSLSSGDGIRHVQIDFKTSVISFWLKYTESEILHKQCQRYAWLSSGDHGSIWGGLHVWSVSRRIFVSWVSIASSSVRLVSSSVGRVWRWVIHSSSWWWVHCVITHLQNLVTFCGCQLFTPLIVSCIGSVIMLPKRTSRSRSRRQKMSMTPKNILFGGTSWTTVFMQSKKSLKYDLVHKSWPALQKCNATEYSKLCFGVGWHACRSGLNHQEAR